VIVLDTVESTNSELTRFCDGGTVPPWTVVLSAEQTAGRGRLDRSWQSESGSGLWCSILVDLHGCDSLSWLPLATGLAVLDACTELGASVELKWPNDITAGGAKLGGILIESAGVPGQWIVGIGINVGAAHFPNSVSLSDLVTPVPQVAQVLTTVFGALHELVEGWRDSNWSRESISDRYAALCSSVGAQLNVSRPGEPSFSAVGVGIDPEGHLVIARPGQESEILVAADVVHATIEPCTPKNS